MWQFNKTAMGLTVLFSSLVASCKTETSKVGSPLLPQDNSTVLEVSNIKEPSNITQADNTPSSSEPKRIAKIAPKIQIAILLDTSSSMNGLINQARAELWSIVNKFIGSKYRGVAPEMHVALYEYGNDRLSSESGYIRQILQLSDDLDRVSEELFALTTNGGSEYCGWVIDSAVKDLKWSANKDDLKLIFIAGNEPFTQGSVDFKDSCKLAVENGITVNTIFCGNAIHGQNSGWKDGAVFADGCYASIDHNMTVAHIDAPQDKEIAALNTKLNKTYIAYGPNGQAAAANQIKQDTNSIASGSFGSRAATKSSSLYNNSSWDLVDAVVKTKKSIDDIEEKYLPDNMKKMSTEERTAYIAAQSSERSKLQESINKLTKERDEYIRNERAKQNTEGTDTLDTAMSRAIRAHAAKQNYEMSK